MWNKLFGAICCCVFLLWIISFFPGSTLYSGALPYPVGIYDSIADTMTSEQKPVAIPLELEEKTRNCYVYLDVSVSGSDSFYNEGAAEIALLNAEG